ENSDTGEHYPASVSYAGTEVKFELEDRLDVISGYVSGSMYQTKKLLTKINIFVPNKTSHYVINYRATKELKNSLFDSIEKCSSNECLPKTQVSIEDNPASFIKLSSTSTGRRGDIHGWNSGYRYFVMDINGDGRQDMLMRDGEGTLSSWLSNGKTFEQAGDTPTGKRGDRHGWNSGHRYFVMDINGDGRQDLLMRDGEGTLSSWLSNGKTFEQAGYTPTGKRGDRHGWNSGHRYFVMDINGDGKHDLLMRDGEGTLSSWLSNGQTLIEAGAIRTGQSDRGDWNTGHRYFVMDFNGDGKSDIVTRDGDGKLTPFLSTWNSSNIKLFTNGLGYVAKLSYKPLTNKSIFTKSSGSQYPVRDIQPTTYVVSKLEKANGIGGFTTTTYEYEGLKFHQKGLGSLGFAKMTSIQVDTGIKTINHYAQDVANRKIGLLSHSQTLSKNGVVLKDVTQDWQVNKLSDGDIPRYQALLANSKTIQKSLQGKLLSTITQQLTYDEFGNATEKHTTTVDKYGSYQQTVNTTYDNNEGQWLFGLATRIEDTRSSDFSASLTRTRALSFDQNTGIVLQETVEPDNGDLFLKTQYEYDGYGNRIAITQSGPGIKTTTTRFNFSDNGRFLKSSVNALGFTTHQVIDPFFGVATRTTDANGKVTEFTYDSLGRALKEKRADGTETVISRGWCNDACPARAKYWVTTTASGNRPVTVYFDSLSRQVRTKTQALTGQSVLTDTEYSSLGVVKRQSQPYFSTDTQVYWTRYQYDELLRVTQTTAPDGSITKTEFDGLSQTAINEKDQVSTINKNALGQAVNVVDALGNTIQYQYDAFGGLAKTTDPVGNITTIEYDARGRKVAMNDPDKGRWTYGYDALDRLTQQQNAKGQITKIEYDLLGRKVKRIDNAQLDKDQQEISQWVFDKSYKGVLDQVTSPNFSKQFSYDQYQRLVSTIQTAFGESFTIATEYDNYSRPLVTTYPTGLTTKNVYNERGYLVAITDGKEKNPKKYWQAKTVNPQGSVIESVLGNGVETLRYVDPQAGRVTDIAANLGSVNQIELLHFSYDKLGNLLSREDVRQGITESYSYDQLNRLTESTAVLNDGYKNTQHVSYDELGNITFKSDVGNYSYGGSCDSGVNAGPHAVTQTAGVQNAHYCYDLNGNMVSGNGRTITYTAFDKPSLITKGNLSTAIDYDTNRSRIRRIDNTSNGNTTTYYMGGIYEKVVANNSKVEHKHYIGSFAIVTQAEGKDKTNYLHRDHLGSIVAITDEKANVVERFSYDPWGKKRFTNWKPSTNYTALPSKVTTRGFTGHENLDAVGLIHMNGRVYDQNLGRFLSADPFIQNPYNSQSLNRYT
ncbi:VCBS repeat-containing protein, partial [Endozoicomonas sp. SM1973]